MAEFLVQTKIQSGRPVGATNGVRRAACEEGLSVAHGALLPSTVRRLSGILPRPSEHSVDITHLDSQEIQAPVGTVFGLSGFFFSFFFISPQVTKKPPMPVSFKLFPASFVRSYPSSGLPLPLLTPKAAIPRPHAHPPTPFEFWQALPLSPCHLCHSALLGHSGGLRPPSSDPQTQPAA